jgi:transposase
MAGVHVPDALWKLIEPLLPIPSPKPQGGQPRLTDRACLAGIIFMLRSGIPWRMLPKALGCGSGMTCWRRLRDWQKDGSISHCWTGFPVMARSTGRVPWLTAVRYARFLGAADWAKSDR